MNFQKLTVTLSLLLALLFSGFGTSSASAASLADGTYLIDYTIVKAENESASMANDYWEKPATVKVVQGEATVHMRINHSQWVTSFKVPGGGGFADAAVVSTDKESDTRTVRFQTKADDLSKPLLSKIHVTVPSINYDHDYTIRFMFDTAHAKPANAAGQPKSSTTEAPSGQTAKTGGAAADKTPPTAVSKPAAKPASGASADAAKQGAAVNPKTGDTAYASWPVALAALLLSASYLIYRFRKN